ncbi:MAG: DUF2934 domain-containing protein [Woeseiaceae bacterium]
MSATKVSAEERQKMVAEAAYFRAQGRGFDDGDSVADWVEAEAEINERLRQMEHNALLERLEERFAAARENLKSLRRKVSRKKAEARVEWKEELEKLAELRDTFERRLEELRERGQHATRKLKDQAEEIAEEVTEKISEITGRLSSGRRGARRK